MTYSDIREDLKTIGKLCEQYRLSKSITSKEVAKQLGVSVQTIIRFEKGLNNSTLLFIQYTNFLFNFDYVEAISNAG